MNIDDRVLLQFCCFKPHWCKLETQEMGAKIRVRIAIKNAQGKEDDRNEAKRLKKGNGPVFYSEIP